MGLNRQPPRSRAGLTIYEVFLALTLLLGALAVLSQHIAVGRRAAVQGQLQTRAALLCETKLAEVLSGIEPMTTVASMPIADVGEGWNWSLEVAAGPTQDLLNIAVTAAHANDRGETDASVTVRRLARDPQVFLDTGTDSSSDSTSPSSSSSSSSSLSGPSTPSGASSLSGGRTP